MVYFSSQGVILNSLVYSPPVYKGSQRALNNGTLDVV